MSKISELSDGGSLVSSDYLIAVRSGGNVKVRMDQINVDQVDLGDNEFIRLGNSQDLTMVHTSTQSIINQAGIGDLLIQKAGATKLTINATGIDVTGTVTADGLTISAPSSDTPASIVTTTGGSFLQFTDGNTTAGRSPLVGAITDDLVFYTNAGSYGEKLRITAAGNVGINTTPKAWTVFTPVLQIKNTSTGGGGALAGTSADNFRMFANTYYDGSYKRLATGFATQYGQESGNHVWSYAASGATDSTFTWSESMRIDTSGNLLVSKTATSFSLAGIGLMANDQILATAASDNPLALNRLTTDGDIARLYKDSVQVGSIGVDNNDNLYIGAAAAGHTGFYFGNASVAPMAAAVRVDSTVDLGTSTHRFKALYLRTVDGTAAINTTVATAINYNAASFTNSAGTQVGRILANNAGTTQYITSSDQRLKENIADADDAGSKIDAIQVRKFDWKSDGSHQDYGMIAQELQVVAPEAVAGDPESEEVMGVDYSKLVPMLVKEIQSLRARIAALES